MRRSGRGLPRVRTWYQVKSTFGEAERSREGSVPASPPSAQPGLLPPPDWVPRGRDGARGEAAGAPGAAPAHDLPMASTTPLRAGGTGTGPHPRPESPPRRLRRATNFRARLPPASLLPARHVRQPCAPAPGGGTEGRRDRPGPGWGPPQLSCSGPLAPVIPAGGGGDPARFPLLCAPQEGASSITAVHTPSLASLMRLH